MGYEEKIKHLNSLHDTGIAAAEKHFAKLIEVAKASLPIEFHDSIPRTRKDMSGAFVASAPRCAIIIIRDIPGFWDVEAYFKYGQVDTAESDTSDDYAESTGWEFEYYCVTISDATGLLRREFHSKNIEDAIVFSKWVQGEKTAGRFESTVDADKKTGQTDKKFLN